MPGVDVAGAGLAAGVPAAGRETGLVVSSSPRVILAISFRGTLIHQVLLLRENLASDRGLVLEHDGVGRSAQREEQAGREEAAQHG
jgi:hypothetical protein